MTRRDAIAMAMLVAVVTLLFADVLFFGRAFYYRDVTRFYYPMKKVTRDIILSGEFPSWNPALSEGQPLAANPEFAVWYPPNWLLLLPNYELAFRWHIVLHYYLAAIGVYILLRSRALRVESAMFGAIAYTFGGLLLSLSCLVPYLFCLAWLPWVAYFSRRNAAMASISLAMIFLGGEPVTIAQCLLILIIFDWVRAPRRGALILMGALLIAMVQIVPAIDHLRDSVRSRPFSFSLVSTWSSPPLKAIELFVAGALGPASDHARLYWGTAKYNWLDPFFLSIYPGLLTSVLAFAALTRRRFWLIATLIAGFVLAMGSHTPLLRLLYDVRLFASFRYPEKFLILTIVPLTFFAAISFDRLDDAMIRRATVLTSVIAVMCAVLAIVIASSADAFIRFWSIEVHPLRARMAALAPHAWWIGCARAIVVLVFLLMRKRMRELTWRRAAVALLLIDLAIERPKVAETIDHKFFAERPQTVPVLPPGTRIFHQADWYGATAIARTYFDLPEMYWIIRNGAFPHFNAVLGIDSALNRDIDQTALLPTADLLNAMRGLRQTTPNWVERVAAISNASYRALYLPPARAGHGESIHPIVFVPIATNPRFYFAENTVASLASPDWRSRSAVATPPLFCKSATLTNVQERSNRAKLRVDATGDALLVCSITRHKYWRATIDGQSAPLIPMNIAYQGLRVPAGTHDIELRYDNPLIKWCGAISLIALIIAVWSSVATSAKHRMIGGEPLSANSGL